MDQRFEGFVTSIASLNRNVQRIKTEAMEEFGLKAIHVMCLAQLGQHPDGLTSSQLTALSGEDKAAISRTLGSLEEKGLIVREVPEGGRAYRVPIRLTEEGARVSRTIDQLIDGAIVRVHEGISQDDLVVFRRTLQKLDANLESTSGGSLL